MTPTSAIFLFCIEYIYFMGRSQIEIRGGQIVVVIIIAFFVSLDI